MSDVTPDLIDEESLGTLPLAELITNLCETYYGLPQDIRSTVIVAFRKNADGTMTLDFGMPESESVAANGAP